MCAVYIHSHLLVYQAIASSSVWGVWIAHTQNAFIIRAVPSSAMCERNVVGWLFSLSFGVWGLIITTHTSLKWPNRSRPTPVQRKHSPEKRRCYQALKYHTLWKCKKRSRPTPVQRKRSPEKRRCYQALKTHTLWKCNNRSRPTPVQRKRSHDITQVQKA